MNKNESEVRKQVRQTFKFAIAGTALGMLLVVLGCIALIVALASCAPAQQQPRETIVIERVITATTAPTSKPDPTPIVRDDLARFEVAAAARGLSFDGNEECASPPETDGSWYANYGGMYGICFAVVDGRASSIGGFVSINGDTAGFGEDFGALVLEMGWPMGLLEAFADSMADADMGRHVWGNYDYFIKATENADAVMVGIIGMP